MIYKRLSRGELLKAIQNRARIVSPDIEGYIEWNEDRKCYLISLNGTRIFVDKFEENENLGDKITLFRVIEIGAYKLSFDVMIGVIDTLDWLVEYTEEGEQ